MDFRQRLKGNLILILTAIVWGSGFVAQSAGMELIGANTFNGIRMLIGSFILMPLAFYNIKVKKTVTRENKKTLIISGIICGVILCAASTVQTWGISYTTSGKSGFITALYLIFVPIIGVILGKKLSLQTVLCALLALVGMYMLCMTEGFDNINFGDAITVISAVLFAIHITVIDKVASDIDAIAFSSIQFFVCGCINIILMFMFENPSFDVIKQCTIPILYSGLFACGIGYTLQPVGQKYAEPTTASIIMSLESVFALLFGVLILNDRPTLMEIAGSVIMLTAIILIQIPMKNIRRKKNVSTSYK